MDRFWAGYILGVLIVTAGNIAWNEYRYAKSKREK